MQKTLIFQVLCGVIGAPFQRSSGIKSFLQDFSLARSARVLGPSRFTKARSNKAPSVVSAAGSTAKNKVLRVEAFYF